VPKLIEEYEGHNIVGYKDKRYGVSHEMGDVDLTNVDEDKLIVATSIKEAKIFIDEYEGRNIVDDVKLKILNRTTEPFAQAQVNEIDEEGIMEGSKSEPKQVLIENFENFQIFEFEGMYFGIPVEMGSYDLSMEDYFAESKILYDTSIFGLKEAINVTI
jgi:hypothetical protein